MKTNLYPIIHNNLSLLTGLFDELTPQSPTLIPRVNVKDFADRVEIDAAVPGVPKDKISVHLEDDTLTLKAEQETKSCEQDCCFVRQEITKANYQREFYVGDNVDKERITADLKDGVMKITLPKLKEDQRIKRKIF